MGIPAASLPAPFTTGYNGGYETAIVAVVHLGGGDALYMMSKRGLTVAPYSLTVKYGANTLTPLYDYYRPQLLAARVDGQRVDGIGDIDFALNIDDNGGLAARSEARLQMLNMPLDGQRLDWLLSMFDLENYDVEVWEGFVPLSGTLQIETDMVLRFRGVIRGGAKWNHRTLSISAIDRRDVENPMVPKYLINKADMPAVDEHFIGKPYPMPCGDFHTDNVATQTQGTATLYAYEMGIAHALPTVRPSKNITFWAADHPVPALSRTVNPVYFRSPDAKNWLMVFLTTVGARNGLDYGTDAAGRPYVRIRYPLAETYITPSILGWNNTDTSFDETDLDILNNELLSDYVTVAFPDVLSVGLDAVTPPADFVNAEDVQGGYGGAADFNIVVVSSSRTGNTNLKVYDRELGTTVDKGVINADKFSAGYDMPAGRADWNKLSAYDLEIRPASGASIRIHRAHLTARARPSLSFSITPRLRSGPRTFGYTRQRQLPPPDVTHNDGISFSGKGAIYGSWISAGGRTVGHASGDVISNPAYYIEYLLREYVGVDPTRIDTASFDAVGNTTNGTRKDWVCKGVGREQVSAMEKIRQVAHEHGIKLLYDHDSNTGYDKHRLVTVPHRNDAAALTITADEIMVDDNGIPYVEIGKTPQTQIINAYAARYKYNYGVDEYSRELTIDDMNDDGNVESDFADDTGSPRLNSYIGWCEGSIETYKRRVLQRVEFNYIDDAATAERRLKLYLDWYAYQRMIVSMRLLRTLDTVGLRMGDIVIIDNALLNDLHQNVTKFIVDGLAYPPVGESFEPYIQVVCQEIPNIYTGARVIRGLAHDPRYSVIA